MTPRCLIASSLCLLTAFASQGPPSALAQQTTPTPSSAATPTAPGTTTDQLLIQVNHLNSPQFAVRQAGSAALLKLEESQLPALIAAKRTLNGEAAIRLSKLINPALSRNSQS